MNVQVSTACCKRAVLTCTPKQEAPRRIN